MAKKQHDFEFDGFKPVGSIPAAMRSTQWTRLLVAFRDSGERIVAKDYADEKEAAKAVLGIRNACKKYPEEFGKLDAVRRHNSVYIRNKAL